MKWHLFGGSAVSLPLIITAKETKYAVSEPVKPTKHVDSTSEPTDCTLLSRFRNGEDDAATAIYLRYAKRLQLLARAQSGKDLAVRVDPEDVVQSVFRTFFRRASEGHYTIPDGEELWKLFLVIALNKVRELGEYHRAAKRDVGHTTALDTIEDYVAGQQQLNEQAFGVLRMTIDEVLAELPEIQRRMAIMRIEGHGIDQIAKTTRRAKRSVERVLQNFRNQLGTALGEDKD
ncbi:MAG: RNA polymerase sigma factor [Pirellulaceae bacterium]